MTASTAPPPPPSANATASKSGRATIAPRILAASLCGVVALAATAGASIGIIDGPGLTLVIALGVTAAAAAGAAVRRGPSPVDRHVLAAMDAYGRGERREPALVVADAAGTRGEVWNELVHRRAEIDHESLRIESLRAAVQAGGTGRRGGDAMEAMWHGVLMLNERCEVIEGNGAASVLLGAPRGELAGASVSSLVGSDELDTAIASVIDGATARSVVTVERTVDGRKSVLRISIRRVRADDKASAMVVIEDVTQQYMAEQARTAFVTQATHELRNPLTSIRLHVEEAIDVGDDDPATRSHALQVIQQEARRLERVVADMLSASEIEAGALTLRRAEVQLEQLVADLVTDFKAQAAAKGVEIAFDTPPKYPRSYADRDKLTLAAHNLIGNAVKYTEPGGTVTVRIDADDDTLVIDVTDTGIGIAPADIEKVFDRFYRAADERVSKETGSGLGLALTKEIARLHGGEVTVVSELGKGSTFTLTIPIAAQEARRQAA